jgi:hypothetical protein
MSVGFAVSTKSYSSILYEETNLPTKAYLQAFLTENIYDASISRGEYSFNYSGSPIVGSADICLYEIPEYATENSTSLKRIVCKKFGHAINFAIDVCGYPGSTGACSAEFELPKQSTARDFLVRLEVRSELFTSMPRQINVTRTLYAGNENSDSLYIFSNKETDKLWSSIEGFIHIQVGVVKWLFAAVITTFIWIITIVFFSVVRRMFNILIISIRTKEETQ